MSNPPPPKFTEAYHRRQWETCYESTREFFAFLEGEKALTTGRPATVVDLCCGSGANLYWLKRRHPQLTLVGIDIASELIDFGRREFQSRSVEGVRLAEGDVYALDARTLPRPDGIIALQTVSWLPDEVEFIKSAAALGPRWIALTGLMLPGTHTFRCIINDHADPDHGVNFYHTFSIPYLESLLAAEGYGGVVVRPFHIAIDLARPEKPGLGTYTERTQDGRRLQISGALMMNWHFLLATRTG